MYKLFVGGFPLEITEMQLAELIGPYGDIGTIKIVRDRQTRKCKGYAFVEMLTERDAAQVAAALDGIVMEGRELRVKPVAETTEPARPALTYKPVLTAGSTHKIISRPSGELIRAKRPRRTHQ